MYILYGVMEGVISDSQKIKMLSHQKVYVMEDMPVCEVFVSVIVTRVALCLSFNTSKLFSSYLCVKAEKKMVR